MTLTPSTARQMYELYEPLCLVTFFAPEPTEALTALGLRGYWDGYFAGRAAPLGQVPAEVVHAAFYSFFPGEAARHIPRVWGITTPAAAIAARAEGCTAALRRILGPLADTPGLARAADLTARAALSAPTAGRVVHAALRTVPMPDDPVTRLWHAANLLREHRGDGHNAALLAAGIGGTEAHVLFALGNGIPAEKFGRVSHLPPARLQRVVDGMRRRGLVDDAGALTELGERTRTWVEDVTDERALPPYQSLVPDELAQLITDLTPLSDAVRAAGSR